MDVDCPFRPLNRRLVHFEPSALAAHFRTGRHRRLAVLDRAPAPRHGSLLDGYGGGAFAGAALAIRPINIALCAAMALVLFFNRTRAGGYARAFALPWLSAFCVALYNYAVFQRITGGYPVETGARPLDALLGILTSPGRGILVYTAVALFALFAFAPAASKSRDLHRPLILGASALSIFYIAAISIWPV